MAKPLPRRTLAYEDYGSAVDQVRLRDLFLHSDLTLLSPVDYIPLFRL